MSYSKIILEEVRTHHNSVLRRESTINVEFFTEEFKEKKVTLIYPVKNSDKKNILVDKHSELKRTKS